MINKAKLNLFLLMTIVGAFFTFWLLLLAGLWSLQNAPTFFADISRADWRTLSDRLRDILPASALGSFVLVATLASYHRYHRLAFPK
jgi:hypothetical protein